MGKIWMPGGGGGGASSDDCTLMRAAVPSGMKAVTADSDDEAMEGTLNPDTTLADSQALSGQTFLKWNPQTKLFEKHTGNMANKGAWNGSVAMNGTVTIPAGYHNGSGKVTGPAITNRGNYGGTGNSRGNDTSGQRMWVKVPGGYYNENAQVFLNWADIRSMAGLTPDKLKKDVSIMGITGSFEGYVSSPLYLFNNGSWGGGQTQASVTKKYGEWNVSGGTLNICTYGNYHKSGYILFRFNNIVDLANYNYIKLSFRRMAHSEYWLHNEPVVQGCECFIGVSTDPNITVINETSGYLTYIRGIQSTSASTFNQAVLNVSSINSKCYIYFAIHGNGSMSDSYEFGGKINQIFLSTI